MTFQISLLHDYEEFVTPEPVGLGDGYTTSAIGCGRIKVTTRRGDGKKIVVWMTDVLYVPELTNNLFSVHTASLKATQCSLDIQTVALRISVGRLLLLGHPLVSSICLM